MNLNVQLDRLEVLLAEEHEAIRQIDAERVAKIAEEKEAILATLKAAGKKVDGLSERLPRIVRKLRHNAVLLAHARDCLRDVIHVLQGDIKTEMLPWRQLPTIRTGLHISVTG